MGPCWKHSRCRKFFYRNSFHHYFDGKKSNVEVPFIRPKNISDDFATTGDVMSHAAKWLKENANHLASVCCIYATAPFIKKDDLIKAYNLFKENKWSFVFSATSFPFPIQRAIKLNEEGGIKMFQPEHFESRSQDLTESYHDAGQFYWGKRSAWMKEERILDQNTVPVYIPRYKVQDIDDEEDWIQAERIFSKKVEERYSPRIKAENHHKISTSAGNTIFF